MNVLLCNLKKLPKKTGGGDVYFADLLAIDGNNTVLFSRFIDKSKYEQLAMIIHNAYESQEQVYIPDIYFVIKIRNNDMVVDIDFDKFISDYDI